MTERIDRDRHGQRVCSSEIGDCFRAAMSVLLDVPNGDHMPNAHDRMWMFQWCDFMAEFGMSINHANAQGPIWKDHFWIASVPSKNFADRSHSIVMRSSRVVFDPSPKRRYRAGISLLGEGIVIGGTWIEVSDASRLVNFVKWQRRHGGAQR